jgi:hypothetical protein
MLQDKAQTGWLCWPAKVDLYLLPPPGRSYFPRESSSPGVINALRSTVLNETYWRKLSEHYAEDDSLEETVLDNCSYVKSICTCPDYLGSFLIFKYPLLVICSPSFGGGTLEVPTTNLGQASQR